MEVDFNGTFAIERMDRELAITFSPQQFQCSSSSFERQRMKKRDPRDLDHTNTKDGTPPVKGGQ